MANACMNTIDQQKATEMPMPTVAGASALARQTREVVIPEVDNYTYGVMCAKAWHKPETIELTAENIYDEIIKASAALDDALVPGTFGDGGNGVTMVFLSRGLDTNSNSGIKTLEVHWRLYGGTKMVLKKLVNSLTKAKIIPLCYKNTRKQRKNRDKNYLQKCCYNHRKIFDFTRNWIAVA